MMRLYCKVYRNHRKLQRIRDYNRGNSATIRIPSRGAQRTLNDAAILLPQWAHGFRRKSVRVPGKSLELQIEVFNS